MRPRVLVVTLAALAVALSGSAVGSGALSAGTTMSAAQFQSAAPLDIEGIGYLFPCDAGDQQDDWCLNGSLQPQSKPPDPNGDIGYDPITEKRYYVQITNLHFAIFDAQNPDPPLQVALRTRRIFNGMNPPPGRAKHPCEEHGGHDPIARFDYFAKRWVITAFTSPGDPDGNWQCVGVSRDADPRGLGPNAWNLYGFKQVPGIDYPKLGIWPQNGLFDQGSYVIGYQRPLQPPHKVCAYNRGAMLSGAQQSPALERCHDISGYELAANILPADVDGRTLPPAGSPNYLIAQGPVENGARRRLNFWKLHVNWGAPSSSLTQAASIEVTPYKEGSEGKIWMMNRFAYRNRGAFESLVASHFINLSPPGTLPRNAVRWYELQCDITGGASSCQDDDPVVPVKVHEVTYTPDSRSRIMTSAAMDAAGNVAVGYNVVTHPDYSTGISYAGFTDGNPTGEVVIRNQAARPDSRFGDYASTDIDQVDECTFWHTNLWQEQPGDPGPPFKWGTWIASFQLDQTACLPPPPRNPW